MSSSQGKILITAFEPFGFSGLLRDRNASKDIGMLLKDHPDYDFLLLPVSNDADTILENALNHQRPSGILSLGEDLGMAFNGVRLEPFAYDAPATLNPLGSIGKKTISSAFAQSALPAKSPCGIGTYHCNSVYKTALQWGRENGDVPVGFAHIAVLGLRETQKEKIDAILDQMRCAIDR